MNIVIFLVFVILFIVMFYLDLKFNNRKPKSNKRCKTDCGCTKNE